MLPQPIAEELSRAIYGAAKRHPKDPAAIDQAVRPILARIWQDWYIAATMLDEVQDERDAWRKRAETAEAKLREADVAPAPEPPPPAQAGLW